jgi:hypothetical protein
MKVHEMGENHQVVGDAQRRLKSARIKEIIFEECIFFCNRL